MHAWWGRRRLPSCLCIDLQNHASTRAKNHATRKSTAETNTHENTKNTNRKHTRHKMYCRFHAYSQNSAHPWHSDAESPKLSCLTISAHAFRPSMKIAIVDLEELIVSGGECDKPRRAVVFRGLAVYDVGRCLLRQQHRTTPLLVCQTCVLGVCHHASFPK